MRSFKIVRNLYIINFLGWSFGLIFFCSLLSGCGDNSSSSSEDLSALSEHGFPPPSDDTLIDFHSIPAGTYGLTGMIHRFYEQGSLLRIRTVFDSHNNSQASCLVKEPGKTDWDSTLSVGVPLKVVASGRSTSISNTVTLNLKIHFDATAERCSFSLDWEPMATTSVTDYFYLGKALRDGPIYHVQSTTSRTTDRLTVKRMNPNEFILYHQIKSDPVDVLSLYRFTITAGSKAPNVPSSVEQH